MAQNGKKAFASTIDPASATSAYWTGSVSRLEVQKLNDEVASAIQSLDMSFRKMDIVVGYVIEKMGITPQDIETFMMAKAADLAAEQATKAQAAPDTTPLIVES